MDPVSQITNQIWVQYILKVTISTVPIPYLMEMLLPMGVLEFMLKVKTLTFTTQNSQITMLQGMVVQFIP